MKREDLLFFYAQKKRVLLRTKNNLKYSGEITRLTESAIFFKDKFDNNIVFSIDMVASVEEEGRPAGEAGESDGDGEGEEND